MATEDGQLVEVQTEGLREGQEVDREVNGRSYEPFLNPVDDFRRVARRSREEFLERLGKEGPVLLGKTEASTERRD